MIRLTLPTEKMIAGKADGIGWMTFNNPERRNAIGFTMREAILEIIDDFENDKDVRVIVMRGAGDKAFVSGSDISEFAELRSTPQQIKAYEELSSRVNAAYDNIRKPLIAMIQGFCMGGGLGTALQADIRIATSTSVFGVPAARLGLGYSYRNMKRIVDLIGPSRTKEVFFTARQYDASEALSMGLINQVVEPEALEEAVSSLAANIAENAPLTIAMAKLIVGETLKPEGERDLNLCAEAVDMCMNSEDYKEGRTAFMEKRRPDFKGR